jgi:hypothetical protein
MKQKKLFEAINFSGKETDLGIPFCLCLYFPLLSHFMMDKSSKQDIASAIDP